MADTPTVGGDKNTWGTKLNTFLGVAHETSGADGGKVKKSAIINDIAVKTITVTGAILATDQNVLVNATTDIMITLPAPSLANREIRIKNISSSDYTITIAGTIDGQSSLEMSMQYEAIELISDGANWWKI